MDNKELIMDIIMWILVISAAITILWYAFGDSPSFEQSLIVFMLGLIFTFGKEHYTFKQNTFLSFSKVSNDISHIRRNVNDISHIRRNVNDIREDIGDMRKDISEIKEVIKKK